MLVFLESMWHCSYESRQATASGLFLTSSYAPPFIVQVGVKNGLPTLAPVDDAGVFTKEAGGSFEGKAVLGEGNTAVLSALKDSGNLLKVMPA